MAQNLSERWSQKLGEAKIQDWIRKVYFETFLTDLEVKKTSPGKISHTFWTDLNVKILKAFKKTQVRKMKTKKMDEKRSQSHLERITKINVKINSCATKVSLMEQKSAKFWIKIYSPIKMMKIAIFKYWYS